MRGIGADLRYAIRLVRRSPGPAILAVITLAVGVGANVALFSAVNAVLLHELPFRDPGRLVVIYESHPDVPKAPASYPDYLDWRREATTFEDMAAYSVRDYNKPVLATPRGPLQLTASLVSDNLFPMMSIRPVIGRSFLPEEARAGGDQVVILSQRIWEQEYGSDPVIVGKSVEIDGTRFTVVGVMGKGGQYPIEADIWLPISRVGEALTRREAHRVWVIGRLKAGVGEKQSFAELKSIAGGLAKAYPEADSDIGVVQVSLLDHYTGGIRTVLMVLLCAASLVLLISCVNIANLLLARGSDRKKEIAIRFAQGATRLRIFRQFLSESLMLSVLGGAAGLIVASAGVGLVRHWAFGIAKIPRLAETSIDPTVLIYTLGLTGATALLCGIFPAFQASQTDLNATLKQRITRGGASRERLRNLLITAEVAVAMTVAISSGLLARSLAGLLGLDPGFRVDHLLTVQLKISASDYSDYNRVERYFLQVLERVKALPGVSNTATTSILPVVPSRGVMHFGIDGTPPRALAEYPVGQSRAVSPGYFESMNIPIRSGISFQPGDLQKPERACIINETLARTFFPGQDPIGRRILLVEATRPETAMIVGLAADARDLGADRQPEPEMYFSGFGYDEIVLVHTSVDPQSLAGPIRREVQSIDPGQAIGAIRTMEEIVDESFAQRRLLVSVMGLFSVLALVLSGLGIYGVVSYSAVKRVSEIGVRMALGATRRDIIGLLVKQGMTPVVIGLGLGFCGAWSSTRAISGLLYGISSTDATTYAGVGLLIAMTAFLATVLPSLRVVRIDPMTALRRE
jgi:putative ABC transport system permease protein